MRHQTKETLNNLLQLELKIKTKKQKNKNKNKNVLKKPMYNLHMGIFILHL